MQHGAAALLELLGTFGVDRKESSTRFGLRESESFGALLNVDVKLFRGTLNGVANPPARVKVETPDHEQNAEGGKSEPIAQTLGIERHGT